MERGFQETTSRGDVDRPGGTVAALERNRSATLLGRDRGKAVVIMTAWTASSHDLEEIWTHRKIVEAVVG
jgi:hypothetical protein